MSDDPLIDKTSYKTVSVPAEAVKALPRGRRVLAAAALSSFCLGAAVAVNAAPASPGALRGSTKLESFKTEWTQDTGVCFVQEGLIYWWLCCPNETACTGVEAAWELPQSRLGDLSQSLCSQNSGTGNVNAPQSPQIPWEVCPVPE